jgi:phosphoribosylformylglycinamidine cyclo-ligase
MSSDDTRDPYRQAGVDVQEGDRAVELYRRLESSRRPEVVAGIGGFYGAFRLADQFVLAAGADGVGTKVLVAAELRRYDGIGQDVVAMNVNDILTGGAEPLFFLDYLAVGHLDADVAARIVRSVDAACREAGCALLGGETAEMPGVYQPSHFDLAGFAVGRVLPDRIPPPPVRPGMVVVGLASSGFHANGYSLIRRIVAETHLNLGDPSPEGNDTWADVLIRPTRIYVRPVLDWIRRYPVAAMAHVTGGGLAANLSRVLAGHGARLSRTALPVPPAMETLRQRGGLSDEEMRRVWNGGIGFCLVVPASVADELVGAARDVGWAAAPLGLVTAEGAVVWE